MNITVNLPIELFERLASALESIARSADRIAGPVITSEAPKPFDPTLWMESSNALSRQIEEEERQETAGFGPSYQRDIESQAARAQRPPNGPNHDS